MVPDDPASTPSDPETSQMPAVPPAKPGPEPVEWPEDPWVADGRAAEDPTLEGGPPMVTSAVIPTWPESAGGEPSVPSHIPQNPTANDPVTAPFPTHRAGQESDAAVMKTAPPQPAAPTERVEEVHDTVPPTPAVDAAASVEAEEVETAGAALETVPPEVETVDEAEEGGAGPTAEEAVIEAIATDEPGAEPVVPAAAAEEESPAPIEAAESEVEPEAVTADEAEPEAVAVPEAVAMPEAEAEPTPESVTEPEPEPEPEPAPEPVKVVEPEPPAPEEPAVEPAAPSAATPAWAAQAVTPATPAPAAPASPLAPSSPAIPSWAPNAPAAAAKPQPEAPTQWPGINVPAWAPQPTASHPGTANPLPGAGGPYADPSRPVQAAPQPPPAPAPAPQAAGPAPTAPSVPAAPAAAPPKTSSWEVVEQKRASEPMRQGPTAEDKSYAEWFAWAKRSGAPASACHAAAQGAFRALAAGHDMNTAVQWATLAMASPPGLVGQSRQLYCAWYSLGNIDLKLPTPQAHAFANGAIQALEEGADSMGAHQAGLLAAGITGG